MKKHFRNRFALSGRPGEIRFRREESSPNPDSTMDSSAGVMADRDHHCAEHPKGKVRTVGNATYSSNGQLVTVRLCEFIIGGENARYAFFPAGATEFDRNGTEFWCQFEVVRTSTFEGFKPEDQSIRVGSRIGVIFQETMSYNQPR